MLIANGNAYLRKLILRSNSGIRRGGIVALSLDDRLLSSESIEVYFKNVLLKNVQEIERVLQNIIDTAQGKERSILSLCNSNNPYELFQI